MWEFWIDVGGTFTDIVFHDTHDGTTHIHKVPTTPDNPARGVLGGVTALCDRFGVDRGTIDHVYLDIGAEQGLVVGSKLDIVDPSHDKFDHVQRSNVGIPDHSYAQLVVISTQPRSSVALVTHTRREVEVGQAVRGAGN